MYDTNARSSWRMLALLTAFVVVCHAATFRAFGATFWIDSYLHAQLGHDLLDGGMEHAYAGHKYYLLQHIGAGLGWLWAVLSRTLGSGCAWLVLALLQHAVAILATLVLLRACEGLLSLPVRWLAALVLALHPFLRAFDNAIMTESLSTSALALMLAAALDHFSGRGGPRSLLMFALAGALGIQFRATTLLFGLGLLGLLAVRRLGAAGLRPPWWTLAAAGATLIGSYLAVPLYRAARLGEFFLPNLDFIGLTDALNVNPHPSPQAIERLKELDLAPGVAPARLAKEGIPNYHQASLIAEEVVAYHGDRAAARRLLQQAQHIVRLDCAGAIQNQAALALIGVGMTRLDLIFPEEHEVWRGLNVAAYGAHTRRSYRWFAWLERADYAPSLRTFTRSLQRPGQINVDERVLRDLEQALRPNLSTASPRWRDPLALGTLPVETWLLGMLAGLIVLGRRQPWLALLFALLPAVQLACMLRIGFSSPRYFQPMLPVYIISGAVAAQALGEWLGRRALQAARACSMSRLS